MKRKNLYIKPEAEVIPFDLLGVLCTSPTKTDYSLDQSGSGSGTGIDDNSGGGGSGTDPYDPNQD